MRYSWQHCFLCWYKDCNPCSIVRKSGLRDRAKFDRWKGLGSFGSLHIPLQIQILIQTQSLLAMSLTVISWLHNNGKTDDQISALGRLTDVAVPHLVGSDTGQQAWFDIPSLIHV